ncbi:fibroblast growth factor-binding protein 1-like [Entelurus aequoreus]|uniref:fibroblast growth factor-binding protein 1-like n=1 Tax=Entelurus aequoreus TaxID=161455 RepID=UPI002B1CFF16|nr:fibroblast growth factor-binding protein 1-like [Entelurus aequoreus]
MLKTLLTLMSLLALASGVKRRGPGASPLVAGRGRFHLHGTMNCTWVARESSPDSVRVSVKCEDPVARVQGGETDMECAYDGKPQICPAYRSKRKGFWRQMGRSFKKLGADMCKDENAVVSASMCKRAPRDAHFKLDIGSSVIGAQSGGMDLPPPAPFLPTPCPETRRRAEEYCSSSLANVCAFFLMMMQNDDC